MLKMYLLYDTDSWKNSLTVKITRKIKVAHLRPVVVAVVVVCGGGGGGVVLILSFSWVCSRT